MYEGCKHKLECVKDRGMGEWTNGYLEVIRWDTGKMDVS